MASAGWMPRSRATSATDRIRGQAVSVDADALEVRWAGLGPDARRRRRSRHGRRRPRTGSGGRGRPARPTAPRPAGSADRPRREEVEGQAGLEREQDRDAPTVGLGDHPGAAAGRLVEEVDEVARAAGGHQAEGHGDAGGEPTARSSGRGPGAGPRGRGPTYRRRRPRRCRYRARPCTPTRAATSSHEAMREATGRPSEVSWCWVREVEKPMAPACSASASWPAIRARSSASAFSLEGPLAHGPGAQRRVADVGGEVDALGQAVDGVEVLGERLEAPVDARRQGGRIDVLGPLEVADDQCPSC